MSHCIKNSTRSAPVFPPDWRVLYQMPLQQQQSIRNWLKELNWAEARQRVQSQLGVKLSRAALEYVQQELQQACPSPVDSELVSQAIQVCFEQRALASGDLDGFVRLHRLRQQDQALELGKRQFARREESDNQRALRLLVDELRHRPDCLELFQVLSQKVLGP